MLVVDLLAGSKRVQRSSVARGIEVRGHVNRSEGNMSQVKRRSRLNKSLEGQGQGRPNPANPQKLNPASTQVPSDEPGWPGVNTAHPCQYPSP